MVNSQTNTAGTGSAESRLFDAAAGLSLFLSLSGAGFLFQGSLHEIIQQKPWIHRVFITAFPVFTLLWAWLRPVQTKGGDAKPSLAYRAAAWVLKHPGLFTCGLFLFLAALWTSSSCVRHDALHSSFDLAIFAQAVWNTLHGDFLYSSIKGGICLLGDHFSPLLAVLALPYALWPDPRCLLLLQAVSAASAVFPVYFLARRQDAKTAALFVLALALYLPLRNSVRFDFHPEVLAFPLLLWAFYFLESGKLFFAGLCMLTALAAKENTALVLFGAGFYAAAFQKKKLFGIFWMFFSAAYLTAAIKIWIPHFSGADYFYLGGNFLAWKKEGTGALFQQLLSGPSVSYLVKIFAPFAFLSFLSPAAFLLTLPMLAQNLISRNDATRSIFFQYTALLTPYVVISALAGWKRVRSRRSAPYVLIGAAVLFSGVPEFYVLGEHASKISAHTRWVQRELAALPPAASLRTHEFLAPQAVNRKELHIFENHHPKEGGSAKALASEYTALDRMFLGDKEPQAYAELTQTGYTKIQDQGGFTLWRKAPPVEVSQ